MHDIRHELIEFAKGALPLHLLLKRSKIAAQTDKKLMSEIGISWDAYSEMLGEIEDEFKIAVHPDMTALVDKAKPKRFQRKPVEKFQLRVPDLSIDELVSIAETGYWPLEYYIAHDSD